MILEKGIAFVTNHQSSVDEKHMYLVEEFFSAACELREFDWASFFLQVIKAKFPGSVKSMRLLGMFHEANDDIVKAQEIYLDLIEQNIADT